MNRGRPTGSTLPWQTRRAVERDLEDGIAVHAIARKRGLSHDAIRVIRDGCNVRKRDAYAAGRDQEA